MRSFWIMALFAGFGSVAAGQPEDPPGAEPVEPSRVRLVRDLGGHVAVPRCLTFTPDGKKLVSTGNDRTVQVWDVASKERLRIIRPPLGMDGQGGVA
jgi:WD40 repeat protein